MRRIFTIFSIACFAAGILSAQKSRLSIENVHMDITDGKVQVNYDLIAPSRAGSFNLDLVFISESHSLYIPYYLKGDVGSEVKPGINNTIEWEINRDIIDLRDKLFPMLVTYNEQGKRKHDGGPGYALLSALMPGLGDYFVADPKTMDFKPYQRTASAYGFVGLSIYAFSERYRDPDKIFHNGANYGRGDLHYRFFQWDGEIFMLLGASIWVYDVLWVASKGNINQKINRSLERHRISMRAVNGGGVGLAYNFRF